MHSELGEVSFCLPYYSLYFWLCIFLSGAKSDASPCQIGLNKRINYWFNPTLFHSQWRADYLSSQIMVNFHVYMLIKIWGRPHILMKYVALTSHKYKVNLILLSRHCLVNNIRLILINIRWCPCSILLPNLLV